MVGWSLFGGVSSPRNRRDSCTSNSIPEQCRSATDALCSETRRQAAPSTQLSSIQFHHLCRESTVERRGLGAKLQNLLRLTQASLSSLLPSPSGFCHLSFPCLLPFFCLSLLSPLPSLPCLFILTTNSLGCCSSFFFLYFLDYNRRL